MLRGLTCKNLLLNDLCYTFFQYYKHFEYTTAESDIVHSLNQSIMQNRLVPGQPNPVMNLYTLVYIWNDEFYLEQFMCGVTLV